MCSQTRAHRYVVPVSENHSCHRFEVFNVLAKRRPRRMLGGYLLHDIPHGLMMGRLEMKIWSGLAGKNVVVLRNSFGNSNYAFWRLQVFYSGHGIDKRLSMASDSYLPMNLVTQAVAFFHHRIFWVRVWLALKTARMSGN